MVELTNEHPCLSEHHDASFVLRHGICLPKWKCSLREKHRSISHDSNCAPLVVKKIYYFIQVNVLVGLDHILTERILGVVQ